MVLIHGVGLNKEMWGGQFVGTANDYRVIAYDMLGHGQSALPPADIGLEGYAAQLAELLDHLQIAQATVIGFSMGGSGRPGVRPQLPAAPGCTGSAQQRVQPHPRAECRRYRPRRQAAQLGPDANVDAALDRWFSREYKAANPAQVAAIRQVLASNDPQGYHTTYSLFATRTCTAPPTWAASSADADRHRRARLGLHPGHDPPARRQHSGAHSVVLAEQRHMMPVEAPREVNKMLLDFLAQARTLTESAKGIVA